MRSGFLQHQHSFGLPEDDAGPDSPAAGHRRSRPSCCAQLSLLLRKVWRVKLRSWKTTLGEYIVPLLFFVAFNSPGLSTAPRLVPEGPPFVKSYNITALGMIDAILAAPMFPSEGPYSSLYVPAAWATPADGSPPAVLYAPNGSAAVEAVMKTIQDSSYTPSFPMQGFATEADLEAAYEAAPMATWAGVVFTAYGSTGQHRQDGGGGAAAAAGHNQWDYKIRINGTWAPPTALDRQVATRGHYGGAQADDWARYAQTGFSLLQYSIDQAILSTTTATATAATTATTTTTATAATTAATSSSSPFRPPAKPYDYEAIECFLAAQKNHSAPHCRVLAEVGYWQQPNVEDDTVEGHWIMKWLPGWCLNIAATFWLSSRLLQLVEERPKQQPMQIMGLRDSAYHVSWLVAGAVEALPLGAAFAAIWFAVNYARFSSPVLLILFLFEYLLALCAFAGALAPAVRSPDRVSMLCFLVVFVAALLYVAALLSTGRQDGRGGAALKLVVALLTPFGAGHLAGEVLIEKEDLNVGVTLGTAGTPGVAGEPSFAVVLAVTAASIPMWYLVGRYLDVLTGDVGGSASSSSSSSSSSRWPSPCFLTMMLTGVTGVEAGAAAAMATATMTTTTTLVMEVVMATKEE
eukprot:g1293.t1